MYEKLTLEEFRLRGPVKEVRNFNSRKKFFLFGERVKSSLSHVRQFDKSGYLLYEKYPSFSTKYVYDSNWVLQKTIDEDGSERVFRYSADGKLLDDVYKGSKTVFKYDEGGGCKASCDNDYTVYDENGREIEEYVKCDGSYVIISRYRYNGSGRLVALIEYESNAPDFIEEEVCRTEYKYNDRGDISQMCEVEDHETRVTLFSYEYDSYGNCVKMTSTCGKETNVQIIEIDYFGQPAPNGNSSRLL